MTANLLTASALEDGGARLIIGVFAKRWVAGCCIACSAVAAGRTNDRASVRICGVRAPASAYAERKALERDMPVPTAEEFMSNLYRMKRDCRAYMEEAERRGDLREAGEFKEYLERVESMIEMKGGDPDGQSPDPRA